jgi:hypothetical protein
MTPKVLEPANPLLRRRRAGLQAGSRVRATWGSYPREGTILARSGDKWKVHFPAQNLTRLCGANELEIADD